MAGSGCFSVQLWWETPPWFSQVVPARGLLGKGATVDEVEIRSDSRIVCRGSVLEKDVQLKEQVGVQVEPPCGCSSKGAIGFPSKSTERGPGVEAIDGEDSLGNRSQGAGKVVREGGLGFGPEVFEFGLDWEAQFNSGLGEVSHKTAFEEAQKHGLVSEPRPITLKGWVLGCEERPFYIKGSFVGCEGMAGMGFEPGLGEIKGVRAHSHAEVGEMEVKATKEASCVQVKEDVGVACFLGGDWRDSEAFSVKARAWMTDEALTAETSMC